MILHAVVIKSLILHPYKARTENAGFSSDQICDLLPSAKRRGVFDGSHEGWAAYLQSYSAQSLHLENGNSLEAENIIAQKISPQHGI